MEKAAVKSTTTTTKPAVTKTTGPPTKPVNSSVGVTGNKLNVQGNKPSASTVKKAPAPAAVAVAKQPIGLKQAPGPAAKANVKAPVAAGVAAGGAVVPKAVQQVKAAEEFKLNVQEINLTQLVDKVKACRDRNRSLLIIDKLEFNDSYTFFKYKGQIIDVAHHAIREQMGQQTHEKSVEASRKLAAHALKIGDFLVFMMDKSLRSMTEFYAGASFFSPKELFVPSAVQEETYYRQKLITVDEDVDGFGNKGGYYPGKEFAAIILSKTTDSTPEELLQSFGLPKELFEVVIIQ